MDQNVIMFAFMDLKEHTQIRSSNLHASIIRLSRNQITHTAPELTSRWCRVLIDKVYFIVPNEIKLVWILLDHCFHYCYKFAVRCLLLFVPVWWQVNWRQIRGFQFAGLFEQHQSVSRMFQFYLDGSRFSGVLRPTLKESTMVGGWTRASGTHSVQCHKVFHYHFPQHHE